MSKIDIITTSGEKKGSVSLKKSKPVSPILISNVVLSNLSNKRTARAHTKTKGEVSGGGIKPYRQKGTGQARAGSIRSPLWIGGGTAFGPRSVRNFYKRINKKQKLVVINDILLKKAESDNLKVLEKIDFSSGKTKDMISFLSSLGIDGSTLLVLDKELSNKAEAEKTYNAGRNISFLTVISIEKVNPFMLLKFKWIVMTKKAFEELEERSEFIKEEGKSKEIKETEKKVEKETVKKTVKKTTTKKKVE